MAQVKFGCEGFKTSSTTLSPEHRRFLLVVLYFYKVLYGCTNQINIYLYNVYVQIYSHTARCPLGQKDRLTLTHGRANTCKYGFLIVSQTCGIRFHFIAVDLGMVSVV